MPGGNFAREVHGNGARGVGLLGYVFTAPEHRGKGAYTALMAHQMEDCRAGFSILTLTTNPDSSAFRIYERFGFRRIDASSGRMKWLAHPKAEAEWFRSATSAELRLQPLAWDDWPTLNLTALRVPAPDEPLGELPRSWALSLQTYGTAEGTFADVHPGWAHLGTPAARAFDTRRHRSHASRRCRRVASGASRLALYGHGAARRAVPASHLCGNWASTALPRVT